MKLSKTGAPLKALATDIRRNLETPLGEMGLAITAEARTGDTPANRRARQRERDWLRDGGDQLARHSTRSAAPSAPNIASESEELRISNTSRPDGPWGAAAGAAFLWQARPHAR